MVGDIIGYILLGLLVAFWVFMIIWFIKLGTHRIKEWITAFKNKHKEPQKLLKKSTAANPNNRNKKLKHLAKCFGFEDSYIGSQIGDSFREYSNGDGLYAPSYYVKYLFKTAFYLPIYPKKCCRFKEYYIQNGVSVDAAERIVGEEIPKTSEIVHIYLIRGLCALPLVVALYPIIVICSLFEKEED